MNLLMCLIISLILLAVICLTIFLIVKYDKIDNDIDVIKVNDLVYYFKSKPSITCTIAEIKNSNPPRLILNVVYSDGSTSKLTTTLTEFNNLWFKKQS